jgi:uncharacterized protein with PIN domain
MPDPIIHDTPTCPHCNYSMTINEMVDYHATDLFAMAPDEGRDEVTCPACDKTYWVQGYYKPIYKSAIDEDDL